MYSTPFLQTVNSEFFFFLQLQVNDPLVANQYTLSCKPISQVANSTVLRLEANNSFLCTAKQIFFIVELIHTNFYSLHTFPHLLIYKKTSYQTIQQHFTTIPSILAHPLLLIKSKHSTTHSRMRNKT